MLFYSQLFSKLQATKQEIVDLQEENARERQELEQTQNELTREIKLKSAFSLLLFFFSRVQACENKYNLFLDWTLY